MKRPTAVVIAESCEAKWSGNIPATGSSSNGLGFAEVASTLPAIGGSSSGTRYQVKENPGTSFTITCSPGAAVSGTGVVGPPAVSGAGSATIRYSASAAPLEVILSGGIGEKNSKKYLIGQRVGTNLLTGGLTAASCTWSVSGGAPFRDWTANQTIGHFDGAWQSNSSSNSFYFKKPVTTAPVTVSCSAHLLVPAGAKPEAGLDVTQSRTCGVEAPVALITKVVTGSVYLTLPSDARIRFGNADDPPVVDMGIIWTATATTPPDYTSLGTGGWNWVQLGTFNRNQVNKGTPQHMVKNGTQYLDNTYPYEPSPYTSHPGTAGNYPADGGDHKDWDGPNKSFWAWASGSPQNELDSVSAADSFRTWLMYLPPGNDSRYVPIREIRWFWHGAATRSAPGVWSMTTLPSDRGWDYEGDPYPLHPQWTGRILNDPDFADYTPPVP